MPVSSLSNFRGSTSKYGIAVGDPSVYTSEAFIKAISVYKVNIGVPSSVAINTTVEYTVNVPGLGVNDVPMDIIKPTIQAGLGIVGYRVVSANTLGIWFANNTGVSITPTPNEIYILPVLNLT
jgi:hypothetical protein